MNKPKKKPISTMTIVMLIIVVAIVAVGLISTIFFLRGWAPFGEIVGSGELITNEEFISDFTSVDARSGFNVEISKSSSYSILVTTDDNVMEFVEITKSGDTLVIGVKFGYIFRSVTLNVEISMPEIYSLELSGGVQGKLEEFRSNNTFSVELSGGSRLVGVGEANDLTIDASGGSVLDLSDFLTHNVNIELSGGSLATINLDGRLDAYLSGGSRLSYFGDPIIGTIERSSGSTIKKSPLPD